MVIRGKKTSKEAKAYAKANNRKAPNIILSGPILQQPADWFIFIMKKRSELADKVAQMNADAAVNALRLRIV